MMHKNVFGTIPFHQVRMIVSGTIKKNIALSAQGAQRTVGVRGRTDNENCQDKQPAEHEKSGSSTKAKASLKGAWGHQ
jgi:L-cysteine desulfidase